MIFRLFSESKNTFEGIHNDETVLLLVRKHWFVLAVQLCGVVLLGFVVFVGLIVASAFVKTTGVQSIIFLIGSICTLFLWYGIFYIITMYYLNTWIVTNHRIIDSRQLGFFNRTVAEVSLSRIQDVSTEVEGLLSTLLDIGDINVQSAGTDAKFVFHQIPYPEKVKEDIMRLSGTYSPPKQQQNIPT